MPPKIVSALWLDSSYFEHSDALRALGRAKHEGCLDAIPALAAKASAALVPCAPQPLRDRLTLLGMSMANGKHPDEVKAWMHETTRLLGDLPQHVLFTAIDDCVKEPGRVFLPSIGEIREKASASLAKEERRAARLNRMARLIEEGASFPDWVPPDPSIWGAPPPDPEPVCTPEQAAEILAEFGLSSALGSKVAGMLNPEPQQTRAEMIAAGVCPPPIKRDEPDAYTMMP